MVFGAQETRLHIGFDRSQTDRAGRRMNVETPLAAEVLEVGRPLGLTDPETFGRFKAVLKEHKPDLPADARIAIRGSAITGDGFNKATGRYEKGYFDEGRDSDLDVALVSSDTLEKAARLGIELRQNGTRTVALDNEALMKLGLTELAEQIRAFPGRGKSSIMIYGSQEALNFRGPNMILDVK